VSDYVLRLTEDRLGAGGSYDKPLPAATRVLYVVLGEVTVASGGREARLAPNTAWQGAGESTATAGREGATLLRYELARAGTPAAAVPGVVSKPLLEHPITLSLEAPYLMRCDRVDFALGGEALPHRHQGGGIRCLLSGTLELRVGDEPARMIHPGQAWFESGREPVYAAASPDTLTSFVRCSILPRMLKGQSSIVYVDPSDVTRGKPRHYTVFVDEPLNLP
jgi:quercetin dioxygenase-like cupin family protein